VRSPGRGFPLTAPLGATTTCDLALARLFVFTVSQASSLSFTNVPSSSFAVRIRLLITNGSAFVLTFPASVTWLAGIKPTFKVSGVDEVELLTKDGGTTWYATLRNLRPGLIYQNQGLSTASTVDVSVASFSLPAGTLAVNGQALRLTAYGNAVTQNATPTIKFGATAVANLVVTAGNAFSFVIHVVRTGATTQVSGAVEGQATPTATMAVVRTTPAETLANAITIDFRGLVVAGGTLNYDAVMVEYLAVA